MLSYSATGLSVRGCRIVAGGLILGAALVRLLYLAAECPLDLSPDEAHYWDWSRHLDWSYYSKGPLIAWLIRVSCDLLGPWSLALTGSLMPAVRLPAVLCGSLLLTALYVLTARIFRKESLALAVVAAALTLPMLSAGSSLMTIDAPYTCLWAWALVVGYQAVTANRLTAWATLGLLIGLGMLAKYTMVLWVPSLVLFLFFTPGLRGLFRQRGFWLMLVVAALGAVPILLWNAHHGWVTLQHARGHAGLESGVSLFHWLGPVRFVATQFLLLLGYWFVAWVRALWRHRPWREPRTEIVYLWWMSVPVFVFFGGFSLKNGGGEPNWPVTAYLAGAVLVAGWLAEHMRTGGMWYRRLTVAGILATSGVGLMLTVLIHDTRRAAPLLARLSGTPTAQRPLPMRRFDPTCRLKGRQTLAAAVDDLRDRLRREGAEPILACSTWNIPGELGFYCRQQPIVYS